MRKLTKDELSAIQDLSDNTSLIEQVSTDRHSNTLTRITVISQVNADWDRVDALLNSIFPELEYRGKSGIDTKDGIISEHFSIDVDGETLINLCMKKDPTAMESEGKTTQEQFTRNDEVLELPGPCESCV